MRSLSRGNWFSVQDLTAQTCSIWGRSTVGLFRLCRIWFLALEVLVSSLSDSQGCSSSGGCSLPRGLLRLPSQQRCVEASSASNASDFPFVMVRSCITFRKMFLSPHSVAELLLLLCPPTALRVQVLLQLLQDMGIIYLRDSFPFVHLSIRNPLLPWCTHLPPFMAQ